MSHALYDVAKLQNFITTWYIVYCEVLILIYNYSPSISVLTVMASLKGPIPGLVAAAILTV